MKKIATVLVLLVVTFFVYAQDATEANLKKYKDLYDKGLISQTEYENLRKKALGLDEAPVPVTSNKTNDGSKRDMEEVRAFLEKKISRESKGLIKLLNFKKTDGASRVVDGQNWYDMWFEIEIQPTRQVFKTENRIGNPVPANGIWSNFEVTEEIPSYMGVGNLLRISPFGEGEVYRGNNAVKLTGYSESFITETGWKNNKLKFSKEQRLNVDRAAEIERQKNTYVPVVIDKADESSIGVKLVNTVTKSTVDSRPKLKDLERVYDNKDVVDRNIQKLGGKWSYINIGTGPFEGIKFTGTFDFDPNTLVGKFITTLDYVPNLPQFSTLQSSVGNSETIYCNVVYNDKVPSFIIEERIAGANTNRSGKAKYYVKFVEDKVSGKSLFLGGVLEFGDIEMIRKP